MSLENVLFIFHSWYQYIDISSWYQLQFLHLKSGNLFKQRLTNLHGLHGIRCRFLRGHRQWAGQQQLSGNNRLQQEREGGRRLEDIMGTHTCGEKEEKMGALMSTDKLFHTPAHLGTQTDTDLNLQLHTYVGAPLAAGGTCLDSERGKKQMHLQTDSFICDGHSNWHAVERKVKSKPLGWSKWKLIKSTLIMNSYIFFNFLVLFYLYKNKPTAFI